MLKNGDDYKEFVIRNSFFVQWAERLEDHFQAFCEEFVGAFQAEAFVKSIYAFIQVFSKSVDIGSISDRATDIVADAVCLKSKDVENGEVSLVYFIYLAGFYESSGILRVNFIFLPDGDGGFKTVKVKMEFIGSLADSFKTLGFFEVPFQTKEEVESIRKEFCFSLDIKGEKVTLPLCAMYGPFILSGNDLRKAMAEAGEKIKNNIEDMREKQRRNSKPIISEGDIFSSTQQSFFEKLSAGKVFDPSKMEH